MKYLSWSFKPADRSASAVAKNTLSDRAVSGAALQCLLLPQFPFALYAITATVVSRSQVIICSLLSDLTDARCANVTQCNATG